MTLSRAPVIPRDPNITVRMKRLAVATAVAAAVATTPEAAVCPPGDFMLAYFNGDAGVSVLDYVPDIGEKFEATDADADDGGIFRAIEDASLLVLDGDGALALDASVTSQVPYRQFALKLGSQPVSADYFVEVAIEKRFDDVLVGLIAVRAAAMDSWDNAIRYVGMVFQNQAFGDPGYLAISDQTAFDGSVGTALVHEDMANYEGPDVYGFVYRIEVEGMVKTFKLNGMTIFTGPIDDAPFSEAGEIYIFLDYVRRTDLGYTSPLVTHIRAGYL